jgi:hypothetical protein
VDTDDGRALVHEQELGADLLRHLCERAARCAAVERTVWFQFVVDHIDRVLVVFETTLINEVADLCKVDVSKSTYETCW